MRILRGLSSRLLRCGCTVGVYETYSSEIVRVVDATGHGCTEPAHKPGALLSSDQLEAMAVDVPSRAPR